ncbi:MAG: two-component system, OmpR family, response regulator [Actinomycetota bacterium]|jgi:two-component system OmpR family response regulator|nr:two-component system, OmpR family, response regulator [Actinomycetota bacterium]
MRLLVVEDDAKLVRVLERGLAREGYAVDVARTGDEALSRATGGAPYDVVLLDLMLPGIDGFTVCRTLRAKGESVPVLMLTARADVRDRIKGLDSGADDYLVKPFAFGELLARLRALIRRGPAERVVEVGELRLDLFARSASLAGRDMELTAREFAVLEVLAMHAGEPVTRAQLLAEVWNEQFDGSPNIVDVYVGYLRRKLEHPEGLTVIRTVRGVGFLLEAG